MEFVTGDDQRMERFKNLLVESKVSFTAWKITSPQLTVVATEGYDSSKEDRLWKESR